MEANKKLEFKFFSITNFRISKEEVLQHIHDGIYNLPIKKTTTTKELFEQLKNKFKEKENKLSALKDFILFNEENCSNKEEFYNSKLVNENSDETTEYYFNFYFSLKS